MATNPRIPPERERHRPYEVPEAANLRNRGRFPWPLVALIVAAAILALIAYSLPRAPKTNPAAKVTQEEQPQQPAAGMVGFSTPRLTIGPTGGSAYLDVVMTNHGEKDLTGATVQLIYTTTDSKTVRGDEEPVMAIKDASGSDTAALADKPVKTGQTANVRIPILSPPANWDKHVPGIEIVNIAVK